MNKIPRKENNIYLFWKILWAFCGSTGLLALVIGFFSLNTGMTGLTPPLTYAVMAFLLAVFLPVYILPSYFAYRMQLAKRRRILWVNLLLGWTLVGYISSAIYVSRHK